MTDVSQCLGLAQHAHFSQGGHIHTPMSSNVGEHLLTAHRAGLLFCIFFDMLTPVPYHHFFSSLILLFIYV